jgi:hypothetical protein
MKSHGNILMNKMNNPRGIKPAIPTDIDEADACMERFIRQKYQHRSLENGKPKPPSREDSSYSSYSNHRAMSPVDSRKSDINISPEGSPPPLPPKTGKFFKFGLRSSSSTSNLRRFGGKSKAPSPASDKGAWSPPPLPTRRTTGLGAPVADVTTDSFEAKMAALQEMGFTNDRRNEMVLKGLHEDLDRAIETLVRLGEGSNPVSRSRTPAGTSTAASARAVTPKPETSKNPFPVKTDNTFPEVSNNPFDRTVSNPTAQQLQTQQPQNAAYNPFDRPNPAPASAQPLESSFQNLQVSQPLFPHSTGGYPNQARSIQQSAYQQPFTPPATSTFSQSPYVSSPQPLDNSYNPFDQAAPQPQGGFASQTYPNPNAPQTNPFFNNVPQNKPMQPQQQQMTPSIPQHANTMPVMSSNSPFGTSPFASTPSFQGQQQQQQQQSANGLGSYNPYNQGTAPNAPQSAGGYPGQFQSHLQPQQPLTHQPTGMDKNSILSLYNMGPAQSNIPTIPEHPQQPQPPAMNPYTQTNNPYATMPQTQQAPNFQQQSQPQQASNFQHKSQPQQPFQPQQTAAVAQPTTSNNPFFSTPSTGNSAAPTGSGSGLAAQAGINPYQQQSSGLGIGGVNGQPAGPAPTAATNTSPFSGMSSPPFAGANSSPFAGGKSPFSGPPPTNSYPRPHMSQPSVDVSGLQNGRHSPDAFASLSARYG